MQQNTFTDAVYKVVSGIPKGKVATYGQIARLAGNAKAARAVGMAMRNNKDTGKVPCHRVVGSTGSLTGYAYGNGIRTKMELLKKEGVLFKEQKVDLTNSLWQK
jgi:methylated-DNA-protein-cysteine methyltransferase related protein